ncbi:cob(I)alamin adenosyltransferase [Thermotomaculum hydrothermale]|uniref:Corrinoid adenosyltransferase n=1 Tax=Thermotomaculum hydrothermale TaxID=981385 RepID=A0A7R6PMX9_9BACT|nr:cob(I)yrinic acid a,c-diamide adenosyltransferase [Thermotomaculum hydrothermale]BBB32543.1 cob(I)alamin adenosyltransferase [Thermotomaculum hydrothermale]
MGITTKKGDSGFTSLFSGERVKKSSIYMETLGTLDELNSHLGLVKAKCPETLKKEIEFIQTNIFSIASTIATEPSSPLREQIKTLKKEDLDTLEDFQKHLIEKTKMPDKFIYPGTNENSAITDIARTVCRRAERRVIEFEGKIKINLYIEKKYLNRLSDVLFVLARYFENGEFKEKE